VGAVIDNKLVLFVKSQRMFDQRIQTSLSTSSPPLASMLFESGSVNGREAMLKLLNLIPCIY
jgi:hypothetical protein